MQIELAGSLGRAGKGGFHDAFEPVLKSERADNGQRLAAFAEKLGIEEEEGDAAEVIGVKVRDHDCRDSVAVDIELLHRHERRGAAIDQQVRRFANEMKAGVEASTLAEGIA